MQELENTNVDNPTENKEEIQMENQKEEFYFLKKVGLLDRANFYEYLAVLLDGGVNISEAILTAGDKVKSHYFRGRIINDLYVFVSSGDTISKSMRKLPQIFEGAEVAIIEAGESIGMVATALSRLSTELKKKYELVQKVKGALTYPAIIFIFLVLAVLIVLTYVIPAIKPLFDDTGVELPYATLALIATSDFVRNNFLLILLAIFACFVGFIGYKETEKGRGKVDYFLISLPVAGSVYRNYILSGIATNLGNLIGSGVNVVKALTLTAKATNNVVYDTIMGIITEKVMKGEKITDAMKDIDKEHQLFPADFVQMLAVGEKTASIDIVAQKLHNQYSKEVEYSLASLTKWIEPIAILIAGTFVLWFAFAIFGAILKVTETVG